MNVPLTEERWYLGDYGIKIYTPPCCSHHLQNETFLCHRFTRFVMKYSLMSKDNLIVPIMEEENQSGSAGESEA